MKKIQDEMTLRELEIGEIVPYKVEEGEFYSPKEQNGWADQSIHVKDYPNLEWIKYGTQGKNTLITTECLGGITLKGAKGCVNARKILNGACAIFGKGYGAIKGRSISEKDINHFCNVIVNEEARKIYQKEFPSHNISLTEFFGRKVLYAKKEYSPKSFLKRKYQQEDSPVILNGYTYNFLYGLVESAQQSRVLNFDLPVYWVASSIGVKLKSSGNFIFGPSFMQDGRLNKGAFLFESDGMEYFQRASIRPIVVLPSSMTIKELEE